MIQDLKVDSARWEQERRAASRSAASGTGGTTHSSQPRGISVRRNSNSPAGTRDQPRGQDYNSWKNLQREQEFQANYSTAMDIDYAAPAAVAANQVYAAGQPQYPGAAAANYAAPSYPAQVLAGTTQYATQPAGYGYTTSPPPVQYTAHAQTSAERYPVPQAPVAQYGQEAGPFVHGSNFQVAGAYPTPGQERMTQPIPQVSAAPSRTYAPTAGTPVYGTETNPYPGYPPPGAKPATQAYPTDGLYGRGAYHATATNPPKASSDELGSPAGPPQRQGFGAPQEPQYDDPQNQGLQAATTPTTAAPAQMATGAPAPRRDRDRDSEPRERERDHRDHRARRSEPEREHRHRR